MSGTELAFSVEGMRVLDRRKAEWSLCVCNLGRSIRVVERETGSALCPCVPFVAAVRHLG